MGYQGPEAIFLSSSSAVCAVETYPPFLHYDLFSYAIVPFGAIKIFQAEPISRSIVASKLARSARRQGFCSQLIEQIEHVLRSMAVSVRQRN